MSKKSLADQTWFRLSLLACLVVYTWLMVITPFLNDQIPSVVDVLISAGLIIYFLFDSIGRYR